MMNSFVIVLLFSASVVAQYDVIKSAGSPSWLEELEKRKNNTGSGDHPQVPPPPPGINSPECPNDVIHDRLGNQGYFFSWSDPRSRHLKLSWPSAVRFCRARCLELVSIESWAEGDFLARHITSGQQSDVWTSGRKCDFAGCDQQELQPADIYGWFWEGSHVQLPPTTDRFDVNWSSTGERDEPQPDNNEGRNGGENESCLAVRNNAFSDGVRWHDESCSLRMTFICEERTFWSPSKPQKPSRPQRPNRPQKPHRPVGGWPVIVPKSNTFEYHLIV